MVVRRIAQPNETARLARLVERCAYEEALETAVAQLGGDLGQYCMAVLADRHLAERAVIHTLADFYFAMPQLGGSDLRCWLFGRARTSCQVLSGEALPRHEPPRTQASSTSSQSAAAREARALLEGMRSDERDVVLLRYVARLPYTSIAQIIGADEDSARKKAGKALLRIRQQQEDGDLEALDAESER